jgi:hypothetical protein
VIDEVRLVPGHDDILVGLGSMAWSGGMANSAQFCLKRIPLENDSLATKAIDQ